MKLKRYLIVPLIFLASCAHRTSSTVVSASELELRQAFAIEGGKLAYQGDCQFALDSYLPKMWKKLRRKGVMAGHEGILLVTTGDSYSWATADFAGKGPKGYRIVSSVRPTLHISAAQYARIVSEAQAVKTNDRETDRIANHGACEFIAARINLTLSVSASLSSDSNSAISLAMQGH